MTAEQGKKASEQYAQDKAKVKGTFEEQAQTNQQVQQQIHELKSRDYTIPAGTVKSRSWWAARSSRPKARRSPALLP